MTIDEIIEEIEYHIIAGADSATAAAEALSDLAGWANCRAACLDDEAREGAQEPLPLVVPSECESAAWAAREVAIVQGALRMLSEVSSA